MILGIESSCDESALAAFDPGEGLKGEWVSSQVDLHRAYGGVVPDLASREHLDNFPLLCRMLKEKIGWEGVSEIAVTSGPGLAGCLALGIALAKSLAVALEVPARGMNHLRGHVFSPFIDLHQEDPGNFPARFRELTPHLGLLVSGGHTVLFLLDADGRIESVAATVDDAAGEALDKGAKLLGLEYPGGPRIEQIATGGDARAFSFPRAFPRADDMKFSFSGLKTSLRYLLEKISDAELHRRMPDLCASYQDAVVEALGTKAGQALAKNTGIRSIGLSGGVANNQRLRDRFGSLAGRHQLPLLAARSAHTGDNGAMIAFAAFADPRNGEAERGQDLALHPSRSLTLV